MTLSICSKLSKEKSLNAAAGIRHEDPINRVHNIAGI